MPRRLTVFLEGPPTDGLRIAQDHFKEYVKPILVASGLDWEFIQGRKEGDVRAELAEKIRKSRGAEPDDVDAITMARKQAGVAEFVGPLGDIVIGRNTWKEYIRGLHEGWLGPLTPPTPPPEPEKKQVETTVEETIDSKATGETLPGITVHSSPENEDPAKTTSPSTADTPEKPSRPAPFISTSDYSSAATPANLPAEFDPSVPMSFPHILGFLNTPTRMYRFLNRRHLADSIGRETTAVVLSTYRTYNNNTESTSSDDPQNVFADFNVTEQQVALHEEEKEWHKSVHKHVEGETERTWLEDIILDPRIASRMRRFELSAEDEARAESIIVSEEEIEGKIKGGLRYLYRSAKDYVGLGGKTKSPPKDTEDVLE